MVYGDLQPGQKLGYDRVTPITLMRGRGRVMRALSAEKTVKEDPVRLPHWRRGRSDCIKMPRLHRRSIDNPGCGDVFLLDDDRSKVLTESSLSWWAKNSNIRVSRKIHDWD